MKKIDINIMLYYWIGIHSLSILKKNNMNIVLFIMYIIIFNIVTLNNYFIKVWRMRFLVYYMFLSIIYLSRVIEVLGLY